jgi:hypothetical protein
MQPERKLASSTPPQYAETSAALATGTDPMGNARLARCGAELISKQTKPPGNIGESAGIPAGNLSPPFANSQGAV